ncbi:MAG TPA: GntP family permease [Saprospiraceae bacterium]|nr:GntP family permease [Saprospiraceae bacterium]HMQ81450.1 GntP family permease [Saprospiraceae bacterium]
MIVLYLLLSVVLIILLTAKWQVHPFFALLLVAILYGVVAGMPLKDIISSINTGFGNTLGGIGMIIILGVIIGAFLEHSGGAYSLAGKVLKLTGEKRIPTAMGILGWLVSIPVFADSGFMLLAPLNKSLTKKAGISLAGASIALALGLIASHTMVPPTPGPVAAAHYLNADLGLVMLMGMPISLLALLLSQVFVRKVVSPNYIDPDPDMTQEAIDQLLSKAPSAFKSTIPIFVPILLIIVRSLLTTSGGYKMEAYDAFPLWVKVLLFVGEPFIALLIGCFISLSLPKKLQLDMLSTGGWVGQALVSASSILLITGAGGIFGQVLRDSGIAAVMGETLSQFNISIWLPFLIAAAIKTAQGSSTVALITTATMMAPMMNDLGFNSEIQKALVVLAIGAGSAVVVHANDSFFWVVTRMSNMDVKTGYRFMSLGSMILGITAAILTFITFLIIG